MHLRDDLRFFVLQPLELLSFDNATEGPPDYARIHNCHPVKSQVNHSFDNDCELGVPSQHEVQILTKLHDLLNLPVGRFIETKFQFFSHAEILHARHLWYFLSTKHDDLTMSLSLYLLLKQI